MGYNPCVHGLQQTIALSHIINRSLQYVLGGWVVPWEVGLEEGALGQGNRRSNL